MAPPATPAAIDVAPPAADQAPAPSVAMDRKSAAPRRELAQPSNAPLQKQSLEATDKFQASPPSGAGGTAAGAVAQSSARDSDALKSKLDAVAPDDPAKKVRADPFPAAPAETRNTDAAIAATAPPAAVAAKPAFAPRYENAIEARTARSDRAQLAGAAAPAPPMAALANVAPERERAKDSAPRTPDEWIKLIRRLQGEGRKEDVTRELAAFRAEYKERADALLPPDLRALK
jgi:hypothetical protein